MPPECHVPVLVEHDGRSVAPLSADGRRAGSEREIPINHRRRTGAAEQESERARSHSVSPSVTHSCAHFAHRQRERDIPDISPHWGVQMNPPRPRSLLIRLTGVLGSHAARFPLFNYLSLRAPCSILGNRIDKQSRSVTGSVVSAPPSLGRLVHCSRGARSLARSSISEKGRWRRRKRKASLIK